MSIPWRRGCLLSNLSISKLEVVEAQSIPFVVLTSNEERRIGEQIPPEWYGYDAESLARVVEAVHERRTRIRELIDAFRTSSRAPFPNWKGD